MKADQKQLKRAELILKVQGGRMTAVDAARELGVSRKTYYEWENRGLAAMMAALSDGKGGRPSNRADARMERLRKHNEQLRLDNGLLQARLGIQRTLAGEPPESLPPRRKAKGLKTAKK